MKLWYPWLFRWNHLVFQNIAFSYQFLKFKILIIQTSSHGLMTWIKFVDLDELYSFVVDDFFIWNYLVPQNSVRSFKILKFKIRTDKKRHIKMTKTEVIDLDDFYNFYICDFFRWNHFEYQIWLELVFFEIQIFNYSNFSHWK